MPRQLEAWTWQLRVINAAAITEFTSKYTSILCYIQLLSSGGSSSHHWHLRMRFIYSIKSSTNWTSFAPSSSIIGPSLLNPSPGISTRAVQEVELSQKSNEEYPSHCCSSYRRSFRLPCLPRRNYPNRSYPRLLQFTNKSPSSSAASLRSSPSTTPFAFHWFVSWLSAWRRALTLVFVCFEQEIMCVQTFLSSSDTEDHRRPLDGQLTTGLAFTLNFNLYILTVGARWEKSWQIHCIS